MDRPDTPPGRLTAENHGLGADEVDGAALKGPRHLAGGCGPGSITADHDPDGAPLRDNALLELDIGWQVILPVFGSTFHAPRF